MAASKELTAFYLHGGRVALNQEELEKHDRKVLHLKGIQVSIMAALLRSL